MIHDFADWLSPMLVKELRQGIRSRVLTSSLFILQGLLILNVIIAFSAQSEADHQGVTAFFWMILSLPLLLILPFSGLASVGGEIKNNTLELIFLTRLNAWRIVIGKWIAIVVQSLLLAVTVLPYIALRYYLGGVNLLGDLKTIGSILLSSAVLSAIMIGFSPYQSKLVRIFMGLGFFGLLQTGGVMAAVFFGGGAGAFGVTRGSGLPDWWLIGGTAIFLPIFVFLMLGMAAARIAPLAENHAGPRRLLALLALLICGSISLLARDADWLIVVGQIIVTPVCIAALSETITPLSSWYRPFAKRGFSGKIAARFFTPGWHTGAYFSLLVLIILTAFWSATGWLARSHINQKKWLIISLVAYTATLFLPATFTPNATRKRWLAYLFLLVGTGIFFFAATIIESITHSQIQEACVVFPPIAIFAGAFNNIDADAERLTGWMALLAGASVISVLLRSKKPFREMKIRYAEAARPLPDHDS